MLGLKKRTLNELEPPIALVLRVIVLKLKAPNKQKGREGVGVLTSQTCPFHVFVLLQHFNNVLKLNVNEMLSNH